MNDWVFVDTCIWASFFGKPSSPEKRAVDDLLDADRVALLGPILAEILLGLAPFHWPRPTGIRLQKSGSRIQFIS